MLVSVDAASVTGGVAGPQSMHSSCTDAPMIGFALPSTETLPWTVSALPSIAVIGIAAAFTSAIASGALWPRGSENVTS